MEAKEREAYELREREYWENYNLIYKKFVEEINLADRKREASITLLSEKYRENCMKEERNGHNAT